MDVTTTSTPTDTTTPPASTSRTPRPAHRLSRLGASLALGGIAALSLVGVTGVTAASASPTAPPTTGAAGGAALEQLKADGAEAIAVRQTQLTKLAGRLAASPGCDTTGAIAQVIAADGPALTALGAQLAADTTLPAAREHHQAIFQDYRVFAVVTPQASVTAACGHIHTVVTTLTADEAKLTERVDAAAAAGADMTAARASLADLHAKLEDANRQADAASSSIASIKPDRGDKAVAAANAAAIDDARRALTTAHDDLTAATKDARAVVAALKAAR